MFDRYSDGARRSVVMAQEEARVHQASVITIDHLLLAVLRMHDDPAVGRALSCLTCTIGDLYDAVDSQLRTGSAAPDGNIPFDRLVRDAMIRAAKEAKGLGDDHIGNEHLLLGIAAAGGTVSGAALLRAGATREAILEGLAGDAAAPSFQVRTTKGLGRFRRTGRAGTGGG